MSADDAIFYDLAVVLRDYPPGDEHSWEEEFAWLRGNHAPRLAELRKSIRRDGIRIPVLLGNDGRVWDGHHRLCVAHDLGLLRVPVKSSGEAER